MEDPLFVEESNFLEELPNDISIIKIPNGDSAQVEHVKNGFTNNLAINNGHNQNLKSDDQKPNLDWLPVPGPHFMDTTSDEPVKRMPMKAQIFECTPCGLTFGYSIVAYKQHMSKVHKLKEKCLHCDKEVGAIYQHMKRFHSEKPREFQKCDQCDKIFSDLNTLKSHKLRVHVDQKLLCPDCNFVTESKASYLWHVDKEHKKISETCHKCGKDVLDIKAHLKRSHSENYACIRCDLRFDSRKAVDQHYETHKEDVEKLKSFLTQDEIHELAEENLGRSWVLVKTKTQGQERAKKLYCIHGDFSTTFPSILNQHMKMHHGDDGNEDPVSCDQCDLVCSNKIALQMHMNDAHKPKSKCQFCGKEYRLLEEHIKNMHGDDTQLKKYHCDQCDFKAKQKGNLRAHIKKFHLKEKEICGICGKTVANLKSHLPQHQQKSFYCSPCHHYFRTKRDLARHVLYHHHQVRNHCDFCDKPDVTDMKQHVKYNHKEVFESFQDTSDDKEKWQKIANDLVKEGIYYGEHLVGQELGEMDKVVEITELKVEENQDIKIEPVFYKNETENGNNDELMAGEIKIEYNEQF